MHFSLVYNNFSNHQYSIYHSCIHTGFWFGGIAALDAVWSWIVAGFHRAIAAAVFSRSMAIPIVTFMAGIALFFAILSVLTGNMFAIFSLIINAVVIGYMRKPHVKEWLNDARPE